MPKPPAVLLSPLCHRPTLCLTAFFLLALTNLPGSLRAQEPTPSPTASPAPTAPPDPSPVPDSTPSLTITPGAPDAGVEADYNAARTPQTSIVLTATGGSRTNAALGKALGAARTQSATSPDTTLQPVVTGGVSTIVSLSPTAAAATSNSTKARAATTASATTNALPLAAVSLNYGTLWAGQPVLVRPLGGGTVSSVGGDGKVYADPAGLQLTLDTNGTCTFGFQAPDAAKTYQVLTRLDNVATTLTFLVPDGNEGSE